MALPRFRACGVLLAVGLATSTTRADLLPADEQAIPRLLELRGVEDHSDFLLVFQNCYARFSVEDAVTLPYCIPLDSTAFVVGGKLWLLPREGVEFTARTPGPLSDEAWRAEGHRVRPVLLANPKVNVVDPDAFFAQEPRLIPTDIDFGFRDHVAVKLALGLSHVTEVHEIRELSAKGVTLRPIATRWHCKAGPVLDGPAPTAPGTVGTAPACPDERKPPVVAPVVEAPDPPSIPPRLPLAFAAAALIAGAVTLVWLKRSRST